MLLQLIAVTKYRFWKSCAASATEALDLRDTAIAIGQFHRYELSRRRQLEIRLCVVGNHAGIPGIAGRFPTTHSLISSWRRRQFVSVELTNRDGSVSEI